jgi:hydroxymethylpyrimidine/phosphomethylpyrimidine kinase
VPPEFLATQLRSIFDDIEVHSVKVGMVGNAPAIREVARALRQHAPRWVTVDPVMVAKGGQALLEPDSVRALITELLPLAAVLTPNLPEAAVLLGVRSLSRDELGDAASALGRLTGGTIVLKGGHLDDGGPATDMVCHGGSLFALESARVATKNTHGTGCTYSSAIAALLPQSESPEVAIRRAKIYVTDAIVAAHELRVGHGHGPIQHFCARNRDKHA